MTNVIDIDSSEYQDRNIAEQARAWVIRLDGDGLSEQDMAELKNWLDKSPVHHKEFKRIAELWNGLDDILPEIAFLYESSGEDMAQDNRFHLFKVGFTGLGFAAVVVLALVGGMLNFVVRDDSPLRYSADYVTALGELKEISLPDGSGIGLNTSSHASVMYKDEIRFIHLMKGEAHFDVSHDPDKPFIVYAGDLAVRAVGTAFAVYIRDDNGVEVMVTEGRVQLKSIPDMDIGTDTLGLEQFRDAEVIGTFVKGQNAITRESLELVEVFELPEIEKKLSWRQGMLLFDQDRLEDVVQEISRYAPVKIVVLDPEIKDTKVGGYFPVGKTDIMLQTLADSFDIKVEEAGENLVYLSRK